MLPSLTTGYFVNYLFLIILLLIVFLFYLLLRRFLKFLNPYSSIILSLILIFVVTYLINQVLGLYFRNFQLTSSVALLILIVINEIFTSRVKRTAIKVLLHVLSLLVVSIGLFFSLLYLYRGYFRPYYYPDYDDCINSTGYGCIIIEDKGKVTAAKTKEALALMKKYGRENVSIKALEIHLAHDQSYIKSLNPSYKDEIGCIIVVKAGNEGYVMYEEKNLRVVYIETLEEFRENTKNANSELVEQFYNSLH